MGKHIRRIVLAPLILLFIVFISTFAILFSGSNDSSEPDSDNLETTLTVEEVAQKGGVSKERAQDVLAIFNHLMSVEKATLQGTSGVLAIAERESGFDPKAVNSGGGVAGYLQWSGWSSKVNGDRWAKAPSRTLDSKTEMALLHTELEGHYSQVKTYLQSAKDAGEAALYFSEHYEGVALSDGQTKADQLKKDAKKWESVFKDSLKKSGTSHGTSGPVADSYDFPSGYQGKLKYGQPSAKTMTTMGANSYPVGQCTWYVANRLQDTGITTDSAVYNYLGNGQDWVSSLVARGWKQVSTPKEGAVMSTTGGVDGTIASYGHVAFVEHVNADGSFLISECNYNGVQNKVHYRVLRMQSGYSFAVAK